MAKNQTFVLLEIGNVQCDTTMKGVDMKVAKELVQYYVQTTGKSYDDFYNTVDTALALQPEQLYTVAYDVWLVRQLMDMILKSGVTLLEFRANKDTIRGTMDSDKRKQEGEFYTPEIWCSEGRKYFDKHIPNWQEYNVWDASCYDMNTQLFTKERGWVNYTTPEALIGLHALSLNPDTGELEYTEIVNAFDRVETERMYSFASKKYLGHRNRNLLKVTGDHAVAVVMDGKVQRVPAKELFDMHMKEHRCNICIPYKGVYSKNTPLGIEKRVYAYGSFLVGLMLSSEEVRNDYDSETGLGEISFILSNKVPYGSVMKLCNFIRSLKGNSIFDIRVEFEDTSVKIVVTDRRNHSVGLDKVMTKYTAHLLMVLNFMEKCHVKNEGNLGKYSLVNMYSLFDMLSPFLPQMLEGLLWGTYANADLKDFATQLLNLNIDDLKISRFTNCLKNDDFRKDWLSEVFTVYLDGYIMTNGSLIEADTTTVRLSDGEDVKIDVIPVYITESDVEAEKVWDITLDSNHIFFVRRVDEKGDYSKPVFSGNCGSGNLMRTSGHAGDKLFLSTLRKEDAEMVQGTFPDATVFPLDFLNKIDYDDANLEFFNQLPERLKEIFRNDEPLIFYMNPPYKSGSARGTEVGRYMCDIGLGKPACDIYYQFMWRVMSLVDRFNLTNCWFNCFGPLTFFTGSNAGILLEEFEHVFEFIDGMCLSAQEFNDTSESIKWGIGCTLWKSRGGYQRERLHHDILLDRKMKSPTGEIISTGKVLYAPPGEKLSNWVQPKDVIRYVPAPMMTSHVNFKGGEEDPTGKFAPNSGKLADNALGTLMVGNTLTRSSDQSAILSMPTTIQYTSITPENFWRCVSSFVFRRIIEADWDIAKKEISAPKEDAEGYNLWLLNALPMFLFEWKSLMSSIRNVNWNGTSYDVTNKLFYLSQDEVRAACTDQKILDDMALHPAENEFILQQIEFAKPYWVEDTAQLYEFCRNYTLFSYNLREKAGYTAGTDAWDAGFQQIRSAVWDETLEKELLERVARARDYLRKDIMKFGFVSGIEEGTEV